MFARVLVLALVALVAACSGSEGATTEDDIAQPVRTAPAREGAPDATLHTVGVLAPKDALRLAFKTGGVIAGIAVDVGDVVHRGQLLATIDQTEIDAGVARATQASDKAQRDLERAQKLYADDVATLEQVQDLTTAANVARADLSAARFNQRYTQIVATSDGVVLRKLAEASELVQAGMPVLIVGDLNSGWVVRVSVADRDVVRLALGDSAQLDFDAFPQTHYAAHVQRIQTASDPLTGTYQVELGVDQRDAGFVQGLIAKAAITPSSQAGARLWVPVQALLEANGEHASVFVLDANGAMVARRAVRIGDIAGDQVEVRQGLRAGERVVTEGAAWLEDGAAVNVLAQADSE
jgi:membrane fusion protein, multidrug efflux system